MTAGTPPNPQEPRTFVEPTESELRAANCWFGSDHVANQPEVTAFKRSARLHQANWREEHGLPEGTDPYDPASVKLGKDVRPNGSHIEYATAIESQANLLTAAAREAARARIAAPEKYQMLYEDRLWCDLLSSMPMCFNLFGPLWADLALAQQAVDAWFPDAPGPVSGVRFEWSPGRGNGQYLNNRTAMDTAIELRISDSEIGLIGIETKYHEHAHKETAPKPEALQRYLQVARKSGQFDEDFLTGLAGSDLQQIWQDHLLTLSLLQHEPKTWSWVRFVLVHPARNQSFAQAAMRYADGLTTQERFATMTVEEILAAGVYNEGTARNLRDRYLW